MAVQIVFSNSLNSSEPNLTQRFSEATAFFIDLPLNDFELSIDCYLQVYTTVNSEEIVRNFPLGKIEQQAILLNKVDTQSIYTIPLEFQSTDVEMAILFLASDNVYLEAYIIKQDYNLSELLTTINEKLDLILDRLDTPVTNTPTPEQQQFFWIN